MLRKIMLSWLMITAFGCATTHQLTNPAIPGNGALMHSVYLIGNTAGIQPDAPVLNALRQLTSEETRDFTITYLGDISSPTGTSKETLSRDSARVSLLAQIAINNEKGKVMFLTGDRDWDNSGKKGDKKVKSLEKLVEKKLDLKKAFVPSDGCPGPKKVELNENTVLIAINTQWFVHPFDRPQSPETDCKSLNEFDFWEELEDDIEDNKGKNIIIATHHPVLSEGQYAGKRLGGWHLLPPVGNFYNSFRKHVGTPRDQATTAFQQFAKEIKLLLKGFDSVIYVSGHEQNVQAFFNDGHYHINSGAATDIKPASTNEYSIFKQQKQGFVRLEYYQDGRVAMRVFNEKNGKAVLAFQSLLFDSACKTDSSGVPLNTAFFPCKKDKQSAEHTAQSYVGKTDSVIADDYAAKGFRKWFMGSLYREDWIEKIEVPYLNLHLEHGGLTPFAKGGGLQTLSLKFKAGNGREYAFRSVSKDPVKSLDELARQTIYADLVKELIATQHPYGAIVAASLLDHTDILHVNPKLYLMPDDPALGVFREEFAHRLGMLEERPKGPKKDRVAFAGADKVIHSHKMFKEMYDDNDHRIDKMAYAKARVFDLWVGDWDRHEDNWKWAGFEKGKYTYFVPIPRDRDHVFSKWNGLLPSIADMVIPNAENFGMEYGSMQSLNFKARHLDRQLATELTYEDWMEAANYLIQVMTDEVITNSVNQLPESVRPISGDEIIAKLKNRRNKLPEAVKELYLMLAKQVTVVGSNKREIFEVERLDGGEVKVRMYDWDKKSKGKGDLLYERNFTKAETERIELYGLGNDDIFRISGTSDESIKILVIGGKGEDEITDESAVKGAKKLTRVYDTRNKDKIEKSGETRHLHPARLPKYNNKAFEHHYFSPIPKFRISSGNGFGPELLLNFYRRGFNKPDYAKRYQLKFIYYSIKTNRFDFKTKFREAIGKWNVETHTRLSSRYDKYPFYYGKGNETVRDDELFEEDYYRTDFFTVQFSPSLELNFWKNCELNIGLRYEYNNVRKGEEEFSIFNEPEQQGVNGIGKTHLSGLVTNLDLDFRDSKLFSNNGSRFYFSNELFTNFTHDGEVFGKLETFIAYYYTIKLGIPVTLAAQGGYANTYGEAPFYHLSTIGSNSHVRAYVRNRFTGDQAAHLQTELRLHFGMIKTPIVPIRYGVFGFYDMGRVWVNEETSGEMHQSYGGGVYAAPLSEQFNFTFTLGQSKEDAFYYKLSLGFDLQ